MALLVATSPGRAQQGGDATPMVVTTDTKAYCITLAHELAHDSAAGESVPADVQDLRDDGRALCENGHVRSGISRLRRALMVLRARKASVAGTPHARPSEPPP